MVTVRESRGSGVSNNGQCAAHVICCFTDNCNENVETALMSKNLVSSPLSRAEMSRIVQKVEKISRWVGSIDQFQTN